MKYRVIFVNSGGENRDFEIYHIRINKCHVALKKQIFSKPHENEEIFNRRKTALIAPRLPWEQ